MSMELSIILLLDCPEIDTDYFLSSIGSQKVSDHPITRSWEECGKMCNDALNCAYWTWLGSQGGNATRFRCLLKTSNNGTRSYPGAMSGDRNCISLGNLFRIVELKKMGK